jgi:hypothetical protein
VQYERVSHDGSPPSLSFDGLLSRNSVIQTSGSPADGDVVNPGAPSLDHRSLTIDPLSVFSAMKPLETPHGVSVSYAAKSIHASPGKTR